VLDQKAARLLPSVVSTEQPVEEPMDTTAERLTTSVVLLSRQGPAVLLIQIAPIGGRHFWTVLGRTRLPDEAPRAAAAQLLHGISGIRLSPNAFAVGHDARHSVFVDVVDVWLDSRGALWWLLEDLDELRIPDSASVTIAAASAAAGI
jgi:hypothetical protein